MQSGMLKNFHKGYDLIAKAVFADTGIKAVYAFPETDNPSSYCHVIIAKDVAAAISAQQRLAKLTVYESTTEEPDYLDVYGGWDEASMQAVDPSVRYIFHEPKAGFIKTDGAGEEGPPLIGFTKRYVKEGRLEDLESTFQTVCDLWREKVPGILAASVSRDTFQSNMVHDIRVFANHSAYQAHADKSDPALVAAMEAWFSNYDTTRAFTGELYMPGASAKDDGVRTSSIKDRPVIAGFSEFRYSEDGMVGLLPDMTKGD